MALRGREGGREGGRWNSERMMEFKGRHDGCTSKAKWTDRTEEMDRLGKPATLDRQTDMDV